METTKKYRLLENEAIEVNGKTLYRIEALRAFSNVKKGDKGGFVESEKNLSHKGNCWIYDDAKAYDNARICGNAEVYGNIIVWGDAEIKSSRDYIVFKNWWSYGRYFTWTRSNNMWAVGFFYGTGEELIKKAYKDSEVHGREYERIVKYVEEIDDEEKRLLNL